MRVTSFPLGPIETNSYILDDGKNALSIDVGGDPAPILDFLSRENLTLLATIITHQHFDHLYGVHALQEKLGTPCYCPKGDAPIENTESKCSAVAITTASIPSNPMLFIISLSDISTLRVTF